MANNKQLIGNIGLYYTSYQLSIRGWNVLITSRNAKGADIIAYDDDMKSISIQVKTNRKPGNDINAGTKYVEGSEYNHFCDYYVYVLLPKEYEHLCSEDGINPECYILSKDDLGNPEPDDNPGEKTGKVSWWFSKKKFINEGHKDWEIIKVSSE